MITTFRTVVAVLIVHAIFIHGISCHGRLMDPPARNSMWRYGYPNPVNYDDNQLWCGGAMKYEENGEKCGVCGDDYSDPAPRAHEVGGGMYANNIVVRRYSTGQIIETEIQITANHLGHFEFKLCPTTEDAREVTQECLNSNILEVQNGEKWDTKYYVASEDMTLDFKVKVKLPNNLSCNRCLFQWTYVAANTWGTCDNGTEAKGCGPQEVFKNCADIGIMMNSGSYPPGTAPVYVTPPKNAILEPVIAGDNEVVRKFLVVRSQVCIATDAFRSRPGMDEWCQKNCLRYPQNCPEDKCKCLDGCHAIGSFKEKDGANSYCQYNCMVYPPKNCTTERCQCF